MKLFVFIFFTIWILLAAAQAELAPDEPGVSTTGEDYPNEEEKRLYFAPVTAQGNFTLRKYVDSVSTSWPLGPWSNLARSFLLGHMSINWGKVDFSLSVIRSLLFIIHVILTLLSCSVCMLNDVANSNAYLNLETTSLIYLGKQRCYWSNLPFMYLCVWVCVCVCVRVCVCVCVCARMRVRWLTL